jgi:hypothetical protein
MMLMMTVFLYQLDYELIICLALSAESLELVSSLGFQ